jgi:hypothetical protein
VLTYADTGWTAVPLFLDNALPYLLDGCFQLPLYAGKLPAALLAGIEAKGCEEALLEYEASKYVCSRMLTYAHVCCEEALLEYETSRYKAHVSSS